MAKTTSTKNNEFPIKGFQWVFYVLGWLNVFSALFWIVQVIVYLAKHNGEDFFNRDFHRVVMYFGIFMFVVAVIAILVAIIFATFLVGVLGPALSGMNATG